MMAKDLTEIESYLNVALIPLRLACTTESGWPMAVSLWFQYQDGCLYCATQKSARVVRYLQNDPRCAFEIAADLPPYCGVRGQAIAKIDERIGKEILMQLLVRYLGDMDNPLAQDLMIKSDNEIAIILEPVNLFIWDFSKRMQDVVTPMLDLVAKSCP
jgi:nitroimidazol reductase NimA-like FMN-containing flavoprotein (pyridoxamine 5'-phosphate oxidase superfamily)